MYANHKINLVEIPIGGHGGFVWNRLHGEREDICEALLRDSGPRSREQKELLQARLRKLDDALDRLMSGSYGNCSNCGEAIDEAQLELDPAASLCFQCWTSNTLPAACISSLGAVKDLSVALH